MRLLGRIPGVSGAMSLGRDVGEAMGFLGQEGESEAERRMADEIAAIRALIEEAVRSQTNDGADLAERNFGDERRTGEKSAGSSGREVATEEGRERRGGEATRRVAGALRPGVVPPSSEEARGGRGGGSSLPPLVETLRGLIGG